MKIIGESHLCGFISLDFFISKCKIVLRYKKNLINIFYFDCSWVFESCLLILIAALLFFLKEWLNKGHNFILYLSVRDHLDNEERILFVWLVCIDCLLYRLWTMSMKVVALLCMRVLIVRCSLFYFLIFSIVCFVVRPLKKKKRLQSIWRFVTKI